MFCFFALEKVEFKITYLLGRGEAVALGHFLVFFFLGK